MSDEEDGILSRLRSEYWRSETEEVDREGPVEFRRLLTFRLDGQRYSLPLESCRHVMRVPRLARAPGEEGAVIGALAHRGEVLPVLDLRRHLGLQPRLPDRRTRAVLLHHQGVTGAVLVDRVESVQEVPREDPDSAAGTVVDAVAFLRRVLEELERSPA